MDKLRCFIERRNDLFVGKYVERPFSMRERERERERDVYWYLLFLINCGHLFNKQKSIGINYVLF